MLLLGLLTVVRKGWFLLRRILRCGCVQTERRTSDRLQHVPELPERSGWSQVLKEGCKWESEKRSCLQQRYREGPRACRHYGKFVILLESAKDLYWKSSTKYASFWRVGVISLVTLQYCGLWPWIKTTSYEKGTDDASPSTDKFLMQGVSKTGNVNRMTDHNLYPVSHRMRYCRPGIQISPVATGELWRA